MLHFLLFFSLLANKGNYCTCLALDPIDDIQYNEYNLIVKGKVTDIEVDGSGKTVYLQIEKLYKGNPKQSCIKITTSSEESMCGIMPKIGEAWLIFAYKENEIYRTSICTRTKTMNPKAWNYWGNELKSDLQFLEAKLKIIKAAKKWQEAFGR